jgi:hypothetical protein
MDQDSNNNINTKEDSSDDDDDDDDNNNVNNELSNISIGICSSNRNDDDDNLNNDSHNEKKKNCLCCLKKVEGTSRCAKCRTALYCSRECQVKHWPVHKKNCQDSDNTENNTENSNKKSESKVKKMNNDSHSKKKKNCLCCLKKVEGSSRCSKCRTALYCSRECQLKHWPVHKNICQDSNNTEDSNEKIEINAINHYDQGICMYINICYYDY